MTEKHFCLDDSPWFQMLELDEVTSTNDFLRGFRPMGGEKEVTLVTAEYQTAGRGAGRNHWESRRGENLLFSLLVHPRHIGANRMFVLSEVLALSIREALTSYLLPPTSYLQIKWPNDIYVGDKKICGMLIENDLRGGCIENCVMGVGINVNQREFCFDRTQTDGIRHFAEPVSLANLLGHDVERRFVLESVMEHFTCYYEWTRQGRQDELHEMYLSHLYGRGETRCFRDEKGDFEGCITDVEPSGHLIITDGTGEIRRYAFKEVEYMM